MPSAYGKVVICMKTEEGTIVLAIMVYLTAFTVAVVAAVLILCWLGRKIKNTYRGKHYAKRSHKER